MKKLLLPLFACFAVLAGCSSTPNVGADYDTSFEFGSIKSYYVLPDKGEKSSLTQQRIRKEVKAYMAQKGISEATKESADIWVSYHNTTKDKTRIRDYNSGFYYGRGRGYRYGGLHMGSDLDVQQYTEGRLFIDLVVPSERRVVWRGVGSKRLRSSDTSADNEQSIKEYVFAMLNQVPGWQPAEEPAK